MSAEVPEGQWMSMDEALDHDPPPGEVSTDFVGRPSTIETPRYSLTADRMRGGRAASEGPVAHVHSVHVASSDTSDRCITLEQYRAGER